MVKRMGTLTVCMVLCFHALVFAHGNETHVMGTVAALDAQQVVVKTKDGKTTSILLNKETTYRKGATAATSADLKVGDRVVVHATGKEDTLTAHEIRFSSPDEGKGHEGMTHSPTKP